MHDEHDIVARISSSQGHSSIGALAAYIGRCCGHVSLDERVLAQGYRFHPWLSDEIPHFFNKRLTVGSTNLAITLQAGLDLDGEDPFDGCNNGFDARAVLESDGYDASLWLSKVTVGFKMYEVHEIADPLFIAQQPEIFRALAEELVAVGVVQGHSCPLCSLED